MTTVQAGIEAAVAVLADLRGLGEDIADEWQYVTDLETVWSTRLREIAVARGDEPLRPSAAVALEELGVQASRVTDPHRAIDWLSTYPQAVLAALDEQA